MGSHLINTLWSRAQTLTGSSGSGNMREHPPPYQQVPTDGVHRNSRCVMMWTCKIYFHTACRFKDEQSFSSVKYWCVRRSQVIQGSIRPASHFQREKTPREHCSDCLDKKSCELLNWAEKNNRVLHKNTGIQQNKVKTSSNLNPKSKLWFQQPSNVCYYDYVSMKSHSSSQSCRESREPGCVTSFLLSHPWISSDVVTGALRMSRDQ